MQLGDYDFIPPNHLSRRALIGGIAAFAATPAFAARRAPVVLNGANTRKIHMYASPTGEIMDTVYWADGEYIAPVLEEINYFMRDWRAGRAAEIDPSLIDLIAAMQTHLDTAEPFNLLSAYRTEATNQILRRRSRGVAKQSYHVKARAVDLRMKGAHDSANSKSGIGGCSWRGWAISSVWVRACGYGAYTQVVVVSY